MNATIATSDTVLWSAGQHIIKRNILYIRRVHTAERTLRLQSILLSTVHTDAAALLRQSDIMQHIQQHQKQSTMGLVATAVQNLIPSILIRNTVVSNVASVQVQADITIDITARRKNNERHKGLYNLWKRKASYV